MSPTLLFPCQCYLISLELVPILIKPLHLLVTWRSSDKLRLVLKFFTCMFWSIGVLRVQSPSVVLLLLRGYWRSPVSVWRVGESQPCASSLLGTFSRRTEFWAKCLGCGNRPLALACTSHRAAGIAHVAGMWLSLLVKCTCAELGQCSAGVCCLSEYGLLGALGLQAAQLLWQPGRQ